MGHTIFLAGGAHWRTLWRKEVLENVAKMHLILGRGLQKIRMEE